MVALEIVAVITLFAMAAILCCFGFYVTDLNSRLLNYAMAAIFTAIALAVGLHAQYYSVHLTAALVGGLMATTTLGFRLRTLRLPGEVPSTPARQ